MFVSGCANNHIIVDFAPSLAAHVNAAFRSRLQVAERMAKDGLEICWVGLVKIGGLPGSWSLEGSRGTSMGELRFQFWVVSLVFFGVFPGLLSKKSQSEATPVTHCLLLRIIS